MRCVVDVVHDVARRAAQASCKVLTVVGPGGGRPPAVGPRTSSCFSVFEQVCRDMWPRLTEVPGDELLMCEAIWTLVCTDLRAVLCQSVFCTDVSEEGRGCGRSTCSTCHGVNEGLALVTPEVRSHLCPGTKSTAARHVPVREMLRRADHRDTGARVADQERVREHGWPRSPTDLGRSEWQVIL